MGNLHIMRFYPKNLLYGFQTKAVLVALLLKWVVICLWLLLKHF